MESTRGKEAEGDEGQNTEKGEQVFVALIVARQSTLLMTAHCSDGYRRVIMQVVINPLF